MANFAILRMEKHKSPHKIRGSLKHMHREIETPNSDTGKQKLNESDYTHSTKEAMKLYRERLKTTGKVRKNAVHAVEFFVSGSPEFMKKMPDDFNRRYLKDAQKYFEDMFGKENMISSAIHRDETTDHLSVIVVPINKEGKLSYKSYFGGSKHQLVRLQTDFYEKVAKGYGLQRGLEGSRAKHQDIKKYYSRVNKSTKLQMDKNLDKGTLESNKAYRKRVINPLLEIKDKYENGQNLTNQEIQLLRSENLRMMKERDTAIDKSVSLMRERDAIKEEKEDLAIRRKNLRDVFYIDELSERQQLELSKIASGIAKENRAVKKQQEIENNRNNSKDHGGYGW